MQPGYRILFFLFSLFCVHASSGQTTGLTDIARTDFTQIKGFDCIRAEFLGLHLGMAKDEAIAALAKQDSILAWEFDRFNTVSQDAASLEEARIYVSLKISGGKDATVLYLLWDKGSREMNSMVFYQPAQQWLAGNAAMLFSESALKQGASQLAFTSTAPVKKTDNIDLSTYTYPQQHFQLIHMPGMMGTRGQVWFKFLK